VTSGLPNPVETGGPAQRRTAVRAMLEARTVAVVGASARPGSFGSQLLGEARAGAPELVVTPVNPRYATIDGLPCLPSLDALAAPVDLVLLGVPNGALEEQLTAAARAGARSAVIYASGYEPPVAGFPSLTERLTAIAQDAGMALCGGNGMGFWNLDHGVRALGFKENAVPPQGPVTFLSASGSAFSALLRNNRRIGFNLVVSTGQEFVTGLADYLDYALDQPSTRVVSILMETARDPARLRAALSRAATLDIPVVALKVGRSARAAELVTAHSGALAGEDGAYEALFDAYDVLRVRDLDELCDTVELLAPGRRAGAGGFASIHDSGAERALVVDLADEAGVPFAAIGTRTTERLDALLDAGLDAANPLDVWGTGSDTRSLFAEATRAMIDDDAVALVALSVDLVHEYDGDLSYVQAAIDAAAATTKPVAVLSNAHSSIDAPSADLLRAAGVPLLEGTASGLRAVGHLLHLRDQRGRPAVVAPVPDADRILRWRHRLTGAALTATESMQLLSDYGIPVARTEPADTLSGAIAAAASIGYPVVLKTDDPTVAHKSDAGGVILDLADERALAGAYLDLAVRLGPAVSISTMVAPGVELALGMVRDAQLGPVVLVAAGGVLVEVLADRSLGLPPLDHERAAAMLSRLRVRPLLDGVRGGPAVDVTQVTDVVVALSTLALELGDDLAALDINPLVCGPAGVVAVDALAVARHAAG